MNNRNQTKRDKKHKIEVTLSDLEFNMLNRLVDLLGRSHSDVIEMVLRFAVEKNHSRSFSFRQSEMWGRGVVRRSKKHISSKELNSSLPAKIFPTQSIFNNIIDFIAKR